ncbi:circumsporozoite protein [Streptomyces sp. NBC_00198]|uniref:circumsporozoite protein n=1 Tax=Streptomyces sp. NBC_00198 TaxID=2975677 RepID=UPI00224F597A|nr:circumsporozoite protein [Streptomyces sp. NBC_00198]MCX5282557.1 circumsporozoite protein [Streptomyces sp. NBC_00198]
MTENDGKGPVTGPDAAGAPDRGTADGTGRSADPAGAVGRAGATGADNPEELRRQIERTRSRLDAEAKAPQEAGQAGEDVTSGARTHAADPKEQADTVTVRMKDTATQAGQAAQDGAVEAGRAAQDKAVRAGHVVHDTAARAGQVAQEKAAETGRVLQDNVPESLRTAATSVVEAGRRTPRPALFASAGAAAVLAVSLLCRRRDGRRGRR